MPKVVIYVRAEDARVIEATEGRAIELWVRTLVRDEIARWHTRRAHPGQVVSMPEQWQRRQVELEGGDDAV